MTVAEIAIQHPSAISVFAKHNIDFCCGGKISFTKACEKAGANSDEVMHELMNIEEHSVPGTIRFDTWDATLLSDFIVQHHHTYVRRNIPQLKELLEKVYSVHGESHPELAKLMDLFDELSDELLQHMEKEEQILFPGIKNLFGDVSNIESVAIPINLLAPMMVMEAEHTHAGDVIKKIQSLTSDYTPPPTACPTFRVTYKRLQEFEQDLMQHIHLENNVLFSKVKNKVNGEYSLN